MNDKPATDLPVRREKENMDEPQEEFIDDNPPSRSQPEADDSEGTDRDEP